MGSWLNIHQIISKSMIFQICSKKMSVLSRILIKGSFSDKNQDFSFFLNSSFLDRGCFIEINSSIKIQKPIVILNFFDNNAEMSLINHRNIISISSSSSVKIIEYSFAVDGIDYFSNKSTFFYLDDNSNVEHLSIDDGSKNSHIFLI